MPRGRPPIQSDKLSADQDREVTQGADKNYTNQKPGSHTCDICMLTFPKESQFQRHLREHERNDKPHRCDQCPMSFNVAFNLALHKATHNTEDPVCPVCSKKFSRVASLKAHIMLHEKEENLICTECGDEFTLLSQLAAHMAEHQQELSGNRVFECKVCKKEFKTPSVLKKHLKTHYKIRMSSNSRSYNRNIDRSGFSYSCPHCGKTFQKPSQVTRHVRIHTGERPFICVECGKAFNQKGALQTHMVKHTGEKPHGCSLCPASFSQKGNLQSHIQRVHTEVRNGPMYNCPECSCIFKNLGSLNAHISKMHIGRPVKQADAAEERKSVDSIGAVTSESPDGGQQEPQPDVIQQLLDMSEQVTNDSSQTQPPVQDLSIAVGLSQDILQQALENSGLTALPVQAHSQELGQSSATALNHCQDGQTALIQQAQLDLETEKEQDGTDKSDRREKKFLKKKGLYMPGSIREENGIRWHVCPYCTKEFKKPSDLVRHIRIHTHEKPFKCQQCFRAFAVKSTLTAHLKTHTGIKAFRCQLCMKAFSTSGSLKVHFRLHTGVRPFPCPHCDKRFRTSGHRKTHIVCHFKGYDPKKPPYHHKPIKPRQGKISISAAEISLQEPILITDMGLLQKIPRDSQVFQTVNNNSNNPAGEADRPYKCHNCNRAYKKSSHLKQHLRSHTGEKPYKCSHCGRGFVTAGVLKSHIRTHSGLKAYKCVVCDGAFTTSGSLRRHMGIHNEFRPYMCPYCQKTFKTSLNCKKHMKTHRYELAQQLQQQQTGSLCNESMDQQEVPISTQMQVEIESDELQPSTTVTNEQQALLELEQQQVVESDLDGLGQQIAEQPLVHDEVTFGAAQNALQQNINQFEQTMAQQSFEQQGLTQGFTMSDGYNQQNQFTAVQQLQDSSTLESQALSTSYHPQNLLQVSSADTINITTHLLQEQSQSEIQLPSQRPAFRESNDDHSKRTHRCQYCYKGFKKSSHLKQHVRSHTGEKPYKCRVCEKGFVSAGVVKAHERTHTGEKSFACIICNSTFTTNGSLTRHMTAHMSMMPYKCPFCDESFRTTLHCKKHMRNHQVVPAAGSEAGNNEAAASSLEEDEENSRRSTSRRSRNEFITFTEEETAELAKIKPREGASVSEKVLVQSAAEKDRISEIKDKNAVLETEPKHSNCCAYCPKSFKKPSDLIRHVRIHTGEKPYKCGVCGKSFTVKSTLDCHIKTHAGQRLFSCHVCNNSFSTKGSLKVHMRLHTGAKPFKCPHCDMRFRTSGRRKSHIQGHFRPISEVKKIRKVTNHQATEGIPSVNIMNNSSSDPGVFITNNSVLTGQFDQSLLHQGLVGQAILPATMGAGGDLTVSLTDGSLATLEGIQLQLTAANLVGQNVQISGLDPANITLQIDPSILQQTLQQSNLIAQQLTGDPNLGQQSSSIQTADGTVPANVVLQPITGLSLQPTMSSSNMVMGSLSDQHSVLTTNSTGAQDLPQVMTSQGLVTTSNSQHEITLTINNSSLSQVLAQAANSSSTNATGTPQEITLTISGQDLIHQHSNSGTGDLNESIPLPNPSVNSQTGGATLTINNDHLLPQGTTLNTTSSGISGLTSTGSSLSAATSMPQTSVPPQNLVMSSSGVGGDGSVTLTLADTQTMLSGNLDAVINLTSQGQQFPSMLSDTGLPVQSGAAPQQVILVTEATTNLPKVAQVEGELPLNQCFECKQTFSSATMLHQHSRAAHGKERIHVCRICHKAFKRTTHLKEHMYTHQSGPSLSSQKPKLFKCNTCMKAFAKPSQLERHKRIHTGERPFECTQCEKAFNQKSALQIHMKKHTGERPFKCEYCGLCFTQKSNMKLHVKRVHPGGSEPAAIHLVLNIEHAMEQN
ncbi:zinc finger protein 236 [Protopterus annectens]|uniref:zinc finger protein 236 n=1 Tax=Protopterus annectens TaxID=7888 RepID=UPI001CFADF48|nr:zinc finger protein 236 [Protopterus annectens]